MTPDICPGCGTNLAYVDPASGKEYSRRVGVEIQGVYDGILYWMCDDCGFAWNRWDKGSRLYEKAKLHVDMVNSPQWPKPDREQS